VTDSSAGTTSSRKRRMKATTADSGPASGEPANCVPQIKTAM
jgi:hypothetical protein